MPARQKVRLGSASINPSDLKGLRFAWRHRQLVLFLGAGVSMPYGLPSWKNLVLELLFEQAQDTRRLGRMWPHYRRAVAAWMTEYFGYDPLVLARMVERESRDSRRAGSSTDPGRRFLDRLRLHLYSNLQAPGERTSLQAVADLIARGRDDAGVASVVTFNFDDLLEQELRTRNVPVLPVTNGARQLSRGLRVVHAHGYVPQTGPLLRDDLIFTEPDYHRLTESVFHWGLSEVVDRLRKNTVLFVGLSMSDPSLRRLLDASSNSTIPPHWQIQRRHQVRDHEIQDAVTDVERRAQFYAGMLGAPTPERKGPEDLVEAIQAVLEQADSYDREVFQSMGVKTVWVDEYSQIPDLLDAISR